MFSLFRDDVKRAILFLSISAASLAASFLGDATPFETAWLAILLCGVPIVKGAFVGLVTSFDVKADVLVSIALIASVATGEIFAAGEIAFIMAAGAFLEERTVAKARAGIERLARLNPVTARIVRNGEEALVPAGQVRAGDLLRVSPGETIAVDGVIIRGKSSVDQSVMTGESLPVDKAEGDEVWSGTVNLFGAFDMTARKVGEDSSLQRMIRLVESADAGKARIVGIADRWATWIVVAALSAAAVTWFATGDVLRAVTVLVVFCPCALVLATPTAIMAGIGNAAKRGVLVSQGDALERLAMVRRVAFDKTGTLTCGKPAVTGVESGDPDLNEDELIKLAASAESRSEHPLGKAVAAYYRQTRGEAPPLPEEFQVLAGRGIKAKTAGREIFAGNETLLAEYGLSLPQTLRRSAEEARAKGAAVIYVAGGDSVTGLITLSDTLRPDAAETVGEIHRAGADTILITGDSGRAAKRIAEIAGIGELISDCLPEAKLAAIREYERSGKLVCMVGDGVNDAPALKAAHVGVAMGGVGSDITVEAADIVLVGDDIRQIPHLLWLSKKVMRTINANIAASIILNFAAIALAIAGILNPVTGALVHNAGSIAVIINSSLLLGAKEK